MPRLVPRGSNCGADGTTRRKVSHRIVSIFGEKHINHPLTDISPVLARSVMGMYGYYFFVFIRALVCIIWYGIQSFYAGNILSVMLRCIFGASWNNLENTLAASSNVTSKQLLAFFMAWLMQFPFVSSFGQIVQHFH